MALLTRDLPGTGGAVAGIEGFRVEEIPAYEPCGEGQHCMALVEKRNLTTRQAISRICRSLGLSEQGAGCAGLKDRLGITTQWLSFAMVHPEDLLRIQEPDLRVLRAGLHRNKLRTGHLRGNAFSVVLHELQVDACTARARAGAVLDRLLACGMPNFFGEQRFGRRGDNAEQGLRILLGQSPPPRDRFRRRLLISSLQSALFNQVLARRLEQGTLLRLLGGEVLQRTDSGALFVSEDRTTDEARLAGREVAVTGPLFGPRMPWPLAGSPARAVEEEVLAGSGLGLEAFGAMGRLARGGRRPLTVQPGRVELEALDDQSALRLRFTLPPGGYATILLQEVTKCGLQVLWLPS